ncbi:AHH domain-containing protein [Tenacibaculum ovolyticum]|uniref:AHH domain-containing protein n=1 Tax=Tenacibaculum ovolyticum TaxID=104270 RepID=UPI0004023773|nr:AHH domain-containing protein [Tenacibaculum ovolyticum]
MKNKIANFLKFGTLLLGISFLLYNCEDDYEIDHTQEATEIKKLDYTLEKINYKVLINDKDIQQSLSLLGSKFSGIKQQQKSYNRNTTEVADGLVILTDEINKVVSGEAISWTFKVESPVLENSDFENFLVKKYNNEFSYFLVSYETKKTKEGSLIEKSLLYEILEKNLTLKNLDLASRDFFDTAPNDDSGGGGIPCEGKIFHKPCSNGDAYFHNPETYIDGGFCSGSITIIDFSHCVGSGPSNNLPSDNSNNGGSGIVIGTPANSTPTNTNPTITLPLNSDGTSAIHTFLGNVLNLTSAQRNWVDNQTIESQSLLFEYVLNNNKDISDIEKIVKMYIEVSKNSNILGPYNVNFFNRINQYTTADLSDPYIQSIWIAHFSAQCAIIKLQNPDWSDYKIYWEASKEIIHIGLDIGGMVPVVGEVCDVTNGVIYTIQGDGVNASLSFAAAIPIAGWAATGSKYAYKLTQYTINGTKIKLVLRILNDGSVYFGSSGSKLRKALGLTNPAKHAHHLIPWALRNHSVVEKAAKSKSAFHINEVLNGIPRLSNLHLTGHTAYNNKIKQILNSFDSNASVDKSYNFVSGLANHIRTVIQNNPNLNSGQIANLITFPN